MGARVSTLGGGVEHCPRSLVKVEPGCCLAGFRQTKRNRPALPGDFHQSQYVETISLMCGYWPLVYPWDLW